VPLTDKQLNRATLDRQMLLKRERIPVTDAIRRLVGLQAQNPPSPYVALWNRLEGFEAADLDAAFANATVVKASLMRITLHAVTVEDYPAFHRAMVGILRASRLNDRRFRESDLTVGDVDALEGPLLQFLSEPHSKTAIESMLGDHLGSPPDERLWWAMRTYAPLVRVPSGAPWSFGDQPRFRTAATTSVQPDDREALRLLLHRYLGAFGPASLADFSQFTMQKRSVARQIIEDDAGSLATHEGPDGRELFDLPYATIPDGDEAAPARLLGMWDSALLAYADRSRVIPEDVRSLVIRRNGDVLPTLLIDGYVAGLWRPVEGGIEATAFGLLPDSAWEQIESEVRLLVPFLAERDPAPYSRYGHWWGKLPEGLETRSIRG
jgi:hypothetical protein